MGDFFESWISAIVAEPFYAKIFITIVVTVAAHFLASNLLHRLLEITKRSRGYWDNTITHAAVRPLLVIIWIVGAALLVSIIRSHTQDEVFSFFPALRDIGITASITWFFLRLINEFSKNYLDQQIQTSESVDYTTVDALAKLGHLIVIVAAILTIMQTLGFSVSGLLAAGGIGGFAIGYAAKDILANFFGGLTIYLDRPFSVGDWIRSPDRDIEGTVEKISWRHTRIRRFNKNPIYVPNAVFTTITVENPSRMSNRRIKLNIGIRYDDVGEMAAIVAAVKAMLAQHEDIDEGKTLIVNFNTFNASSIDFLVYCFTKTSVWETYHEIRQDVLLSIADVIAKHGAEMAFPTQTLHIASGSPDGEGA